MKRIITTAQIIMIALMVTTAAAQDDYNVTATKLNDHLYLLTPMVFASHPNIVASIGPDGLLLVDTGVKEAVGRLKEVLDSLGNSSPRYIINTHAHTDHTGGNRVFDNNPTVIAYKIVRDRLRSRYYLLEEYPDFALPNILFDDSLTVFFNGEQIRIISLPGCHSDNDAIVIFTESNIVCMGDLVYGLEFPSGPYSLEYPDILQKAIDILPEDARLIAGHGRECTMDELRQYKDMIASTIDIVKKGISDGKDVPTLQKEKVLNDWDSYGHGEFTADIWIAGIASNLQEIERKEPLIEPLYYALKDGGIDAVISKYFELKKSSYDKYSFSEYILYSFGNYMMNKSKFQESVRLYRLMADEYPDSWLAYYCLGEAYASLEDPEMARKNFDKALELDPENWYATEAIKRLESASEKN